MVQNTFLRFESGCTLDGNVSEQDARMANEFMSTMSTSNQIERVPSIFSHCSCIGYSCIYRCSGLYLGGRSWTNKITVSNTKRSHKRRDFILCYTEQLYSLTTKWKEVWVCGCADSERPRTLGELITVLHCDESIWWWWKSGGGCRRVGNAGF